jgi:hypothetical protein
VLLRGRGTGGCWAAAQLSMPTCIDVVGEHAAELTNMGHPAHHHELLQASR